MEKGERTYFKIYDIKKSEYHYTIRYKAWDWTENDNKFYQKYDERNKIIVHKMLGYIGLNVTSIHNNREFLMSIILDDVEDYLTHVFWASNVIQYETWFIVHEENYFVYTRYSKDGYIIEYKIVSGDDIIFRARYDGGLESPTNNDLGFDLLPFIITTSGIIGITLIFGFIFRKKGAK